MSVEIPYPIHYMNSVNFVTSHKDIDTICCTCLTSILINKSNELYYSLVVDVFFASRLLRLHPLPFHRYRPPLRDRVRRQYAQLFVAQLLLLLPPPGAAAAAGGTPQGNMRGVRSRRRAHATRLKLLLLLPVVMVVASWGR